LTNPRTLFDSPWKEIVETYLPDFMAFFFPDAHSQIDWDRGFEFLDSEFRQVVRDAELGKRFVDKLVKLYLTDGEETWVLIHLEIQSQYESTFTERIYVYNYRIYDRYRRKVASFIRPLAKVFHGMMKSYLFLELVTVVKRSPFDRAIAAQIVHGF
jgi:hypothetical protein